MDETAVKAILATQEQAFRSALEVFMKQAKEEVHTLRDTLQEVIKSLEFTQKEVDDLKQKLKQYEREDEQNKALIKKVNEDLSASGQHIQILEERCNFQEDYSRRNNLHIVGIEEKQSETWEQTADLVSNLLETKLELPNIQLERAHRVGQRSEQRDRPVIVRFSRYCDREAVLRNVAKLRGTKIYINEDLCPASQAIKKAQIPLLKEARNQGKIAYFRHTKLIIKERNGASAREPSLSTGPAPPGTAVRGGADESHRVREPTGGDDSTSAGGAHGGVGAVDGGAAGGSVTGVTVAGAWRSADGELSSGGAVAPVAGDGAAARTPARMSHVASPSASHPVETTSKTMTQRQLRTSQRGPKKQ